MSELRGKRVETDRVIECFRGEQSFLQRRLKPERLLRPVRSHKKVKKAASSKLAAFFVLLNVMKL